MNHADLANWEQSTFAVGDRVRVLGKLTGTVVEIVPVFDLSHHVDIDRPRDTGWYHESDLERLDVDPETAADVAAMPTRVSGPSPMDGGGSGSTPEPPAEKPSIPGAAFAPLSLEDLAAQVAHLTKRLAKVDRLLLLQAEINRSTADAIDAALSTLEDPKFNDSGSVLGADGIPY